MTEGVYEDVILEVDPEAAEEMFAPEGSYTNAEHEAVLYGVSKRSFEAKGRPVNYLDFTAMFRYNGDTVFAHSEPFGEFNTRLDKGQRSKAEEFLRALGIFGRPASEAEGLPVTVTVGVKEYVAKADRLSEAELAAGGKQRKSHRNFIKAIVLEG